MKIAPNGTKLQGTKDLCPCIAQVDPDDPIREDGEPNYIGNSEMDWDGQYITLRKGQRVWVDEDGEEWLESELVDAPEETNDD